MSTKQINKQIYTDKQWISTLKNKGIEEHNRKKILHIATEYYKHLYSHTDKAEASKHIEHQNNAVPRFLIEEIAKVVKELKPDKSPGHDNINNETIQLAGDEMIFLLKILFNKILETEQIPHQWKKTHIILLHKKGDKDTLDNYRPISLIPVISKIFTTLIQKRIRNTLEEFQTTDQAGFRKSRSTIHHLQVINQLIEKCTEYNIIVYICFIDYTKAFDSLEHKSIWEALRRANIEEKYTRIITQLYSNNIACIKLEGQGELFPIQKGVRQGDPLSADIYNAVSQHLVNQLGWEEKDYGININGKRLNILRFADDTAIITKNAIEMQQAILELQEISKSVGLTINFKKTKILSNSITKPHININGETIDYKEDHIYLGQLFSFKNRQEKELNRRINIAWKKYWSLKHIFKGNFQIEIKRKIFDMCVSPTMTYGCQTWALTKLQEQKIKSNQNRMERSMLKITWKDKMRVSEIKKKTRIADITETIKTLKWSWAGHIIRNDRSWTRDITEWIPLEKKRNRGRQRKRWTDDFIKEAGNTWTRTTRDRQHWKLLGEAFVQRDNQLT